MFPIVRILTWGLGCTGDERKLLPLHASLWQAGGGPLLRKWILRMRVEPQQVAPTPDLGVLKCCPQGQRDGRDTVTTGVSLKALHFCLPAFHRLSLLLDELFPAVELSEQGTPFSFGHRVEQRDCSEIKQACG